LINLIHNNVSGIDRFDWEFYDLDDGVEAGTSPWLGVVQIAQSNKDCLSYSQFTDLLDNLLHEGMHSTDSIWQRSVDFRAQPMHTPNHDSIVRRVQWEMGEPALVANFPPGKGINDYLGQPVPFTGDLWGIGTVNMLGANRKKSGLLDLTQGLYDSLYPNGLEGCECNE
jgi:hypothetical protein